MAITSEEVVILAGCHSRRPGIPPGPTRGEIGHDGYDHTRPVRGCTRIAGISRGAIEPRDRRAKCSMNCRETPRC